MTISLILLMPAITRMAYTQQATSIVAQTIDMPAGGGPKSIPFTVQPGISNGYVSGSVLITGGLLSMIDFSIVNTDTGTDIMRQTYINQGKVGIYLPAGNYAIQLVNSGILAGEIKHVTLTLNLS
jgi:hypothetical protein